MGENTRMICSCVDIFQRRKKKDDKQPVVYKRNDKTHTDVQCFFSSAFFLFHFFPASVQVLFCFGYLYHVDNVHGWIMTTWGIS